MKNYGMLLIFVFCFLCDKTYATCTGRCYELYCGPNGSHGYCVDYIVQRRGFRQMGDAREWVGNISRDDVRMGDVAIFDFGSYGHVAIVERKMNTTITISQKNNGPCKTQRCDRACGVTDYYNQITIDTIPINSVSRFWRPADACVDNPDGGQTCYHGETVHIIHPQYRCSNDLCWERGGDTNCYDARRWYQVRGFVYYNRTKSDSVTERTIDMCAEVYR